MNALLCFLAEFWS